MAKVKKVRNTASYCTNLMKRKLMKRKLMTRLSSSHTSSHTFNFVAPNSQQKGLSTPTLHNNKMPTFSATSSSTSTPPELSAPKAEMHVFDDKFTNLMQQITLSSSGPFSFSAPSPSTCTAPSTARTAPKFFTYNSAPKYNSPICSFDDNLAGLEELLGISSSRQPFSFSAPADKLKLNNNISDADQIKPHVGCARRCIYNDLDPFCLGPEFVVPPHIKEFCELALDKYNNENGTSYRYMEPALAEEVAEAHDTNHFFLFRACAPGDDISRSKHFSAEFTSGFRYYEGSTSYVKELKNVSLMATAKMTLF